MLLPAWDVTRTTCLLSVQPEHPSLRGPMWSNGNPSRPGPARLPCGRRELSNSMIVLWSVEEAREEGETRGDEICSELLGRG